jgi:hypothetical protein
VPTRIVQLKVDFACQSGPNELGKGARVTMTANGMKVAEGELARTIPATISIQ